MTDYFPRIRVRLDALYLVGPRESLQGDPFLPLSTRTPCSAIYVWVEQKITSLVQRLPFEPPLLEILSVPSMLLDVPACLTETANFVTTSVTTLRDFPGQRKSSYKFQQLVSALLLWKVWQGLLATIPRILGFTPSFCLLAKPFVMKSFRTFQRVAWPGPGRDTLQESWLGSYALFLPLSPNPFRKYHELCSNFPACGMAFLGDHTCARLSRV